jgi:hypothetical protein
MYMMHETFRLPFRVPIAASHAIARTPDVGEHAKL